VLDRRAISDSTRIIEALERSHPEPPLYPDEAAAHERALALEDLFDEQLGPHVRLLAVDRMLLEPSVMLGAFVPDLTGIRRFGARVTFPLVRRRARAGLGIDERSVAVAHEKLRAAGERFRAELQPSGYLVGAAFTVADLALAALLTPIVAPEQFPYPQPQRDHPLLAPLRAVLADYGLVDWTREMYARHRGRSAEVSR
jgi:glutathione S-transferase